MFQYACGKSLSLSLNEKLFIDKSLLNANPAELNITPREYELHVFNISDPVIVYEEPFGVSKNLPYRVNKFLDPLVKKFSKEKVFTDKDPVDDIIKNLPETIILNGFFQKEKYFISHETEIRKLFSFRDTLSGQNAGLSEKIKSTLSVSVHVRRGDYVFNPETNAYHGVCSPEYYRKAIRLMKEKHGDCYFFVFSDDIEWCRANLEVGEKTAFVSHNTGRNSYLDMQLMSLCKHHIIANSSFSWWGAWLNPSSDKTVIAPAKWFAEGKHDTAGLYPKKWQLL
jgi:hypothetical protein